MSSLRSSRQRLHGRSWELRASSVVASWCHLSPAFRLVSTSRVSRSSDTAPNHDHAKISGAISGGSGGGPLAGLKVLEIGHLIAAPFCGFLLAYYGADVIKVESPLKGDPLRAWREIDTDGVSPWFRSLARNKRSVTIDLRREEGRE